jgi:hypothetical protein
LDLWPLKKINWKKSSKSYLRLCLPRSSCVLDAGWPDEFVKKWPKTSPNRFFKST